MHQASLSTRLFLATTFLLVVLLGTAYLQTILHFHTYLALAICLADTIIASAILFSGSD